MNNCIIKTLAYSKQVRLLFVDNTDIIREICGQKGMNKLLKTALGRTVSIASLISGTLKDKQRVSLKVTASNRNHKIFADVDSMGNIRGYLSDEFLNTPWNYSSSSSIKQLIGTTGYIQVMKDLGMNSIFTGITEMPYGNIIDDFSHYFKQSEQTYSLFYLSLIFDENEEIVLSRGIMAQLLPGASINLIDDIKNAISDNPILLSSVDKKITLRDIPDLLFRDIEIVGFDEIRFFCGCSKEIFQPMLYSLNKEELIEVYENSKPIEVVCNVCGKKYSFNKSDIKSLIL